MTALHSTTSTAPIDPPAYSVAEFCASHKIGRSILYELWQQGRGPAIIKIGTRTIIPGEAAAAWRAANTQAGQLERRRP